MVTIAGFGSLLSETSTRCTFGDNVRNFRLARMAGFRRVFSYPASMFFQRGIANMQTKEIASLTTEPAEGHSFLICVFDIPEELLPNLYEREDEYRIIPLKFRELDGSPGAEALMCTSWTDEEYILTRGQESFDNKYKKFGLDSIWGWDSESGLLPCRVYLRHCLLAVKKLGEEVYDDFIQTTFLADRKTTVKEYIGANPAIMLESPPLHLAACYNG